MRLLIELEGVLADLQPACWWAYGQAASELQAARTDPTTFWRVLRTAAPLGQLLRQLKPRHHEVFERRFAELLESDEAIGRYRAHPDISTVVAALGKTTDRVLVTLGTNRSARQQWLNHGGLSDRFAEMQGITLDPANRSAQLLKLTDGSPTTVVASSAALIRAADGVGLATIGIAAGICTPRRLTQAGAGRVCADLEDLTATD